MALSTQIDGFMGLNGFYWFFGTVEDRNDPMKLGRVKVRIVGIHPEELVKDESIGVGIPVADLPWAVPMMPTTSTCVGGIGETPSLIESSWVFGFARDGRTYNDLVIMGTFAGIPQTQNKNIGFGDSLKTDTRPFRPDEASTVPPENYPKKSFIKESDINRLARNDKIDQTIVKLKRDNEDKKVSLANVTTTWDEPTTPYNAVYPNNHVKETESGHIIEFDDTPSAERIHEYHRSGTFREIHPDGTNVVKIVGNDFEIDLKDKNLHVKGNINITVEGNSNIYIKKNAEIQVDGNINEVVKGNVNRQVSGNITESVGGNFTRNVSGTISDTAGGTMTHKGSTIQHN